ncbi:MAG TPA: hypothetical protein VHT04_11200 [Stellaceae bacterium]|jgi:uncharacterized protein|nr:hypothetical protein [Stellaceae bacterium]
MLGIGLGKLLLLVLLILVIWYGFKFVNRAEQVRETFRRAARDAAERGQPRGSVGGGQARGQARSRGRRGAPAIEAEDMVKCRACGVYVTAAGASNCGRPDCPW